MTRTIKNIDVVVYAAYAHEKFPQRLSSNNVTGSV